MAQLRALGTTLATVGVVDHLAQNIAAIKKEREEVMREKRLRDRALRNEQRKKQRLLQKVEKVTTEDLMYVLNTRCVRQSQRDNGADRASSSTEDASATSATPPTPTPKRRAAATSPKTPEGTGGGAGNGS